ncbi:MAG: hypothetical protein KBS56_05000 [Clostridiales bacterium]|nr:hypothetical protein [Candidatus Crickella equi]
MKRGFFRTLLVLMMTTALVVGTASISFAATSPKSIKYQGSGKVTVAFKTKVTYKDVSVTVKDSGGKSYKTSIKSKGNTSITFLIKSYKAGKTYKVTVGGLNSASVKGSFKIYSKTKAASVAKSKAKTEWKASGFKNVKVSSGSCKSVSAWRVTFEDSEGRSYLYFIGQQTGKFLSGGLV